MQVLDDPCDVDPPAISPATSPASADLLGGDPLPEQRALLRDDRPRDDLGTCTRARANDTAWAIDGGTGRCAQPVVDIPDVPGTALTAVKSLPVVCSVLSNEDIEIGLASRAIQAVDQTSDSFHFILVTALSRHPLLKQTQLIHNSARVR